MATHHAEPGELIDIPTWADEFEEEKTKSIAKLKEMQLVRLVLKEGQEFSEHRVTGPISVYCVSGEFELTAEGVTQVIKEKQMIYLAPGVLLSLRGINESVILLTIVFVN